MSLIGELYSARIELCLMKEELEQLKEEYNNYRRIIESKSNNKKVRFIKDHINWYDRDDLKRMANQVSEEEWLDDYCNTARRQEAKRRSKEREERRREEEKKRAAERKALDELMERERIERDRKKKEAN